LYEAKVYNHLKYQYILLLWLQDFTWNGFYLKKRGD